MKNDNLKKNGQFRNVRVEYGFGAVCSSILWDFIGLRYWIILITFMFFWLQYGNFQ